MNKVTAIKSAPLLRVLVLLGVALFLAGCTRGMSDLHSWVTQEKAKKGMPIQALPVIKTFETFKYQDQDKRDPFSPSPAELQTGSTGNGPRPDANRAKEPLEMFALDSLKMVGTVGAGTSMVVLVKDPDGVIHRVRRGEYLGQNYGHVTTVSDDHIELVELVSNGNGGWMERPASIALGEK
jgi:type IV pilus assembly protein PilP